MGTVGALVDRAMAQEPPVGHCNPWKMRAEDDVVRGAPKGRTFEKRRRTQPQLNNGIKYPGKGNVKIPWERPWCLRSSR
jgi:hypothetical protein